MVIHFLLTLLTGLAQAETPEGFLFRTEVPQKTFFQGEQITVNFVLEAATEQAIEVEVMKFPEFRGFWSENLTLRQGPIRLMNVLGVKKRAMALVGSYSLSSIVGIKAPQIEPMRILVKSFGAPPVILISEGTYPAFSELPPIPRHFATRPFSGAVGNFSLLVNQTQIPFRKNQPFLIRAELQGEGNFSEINTIPLGLPPEINLISQNSTSGSYLGNAKRKQFEWILSTERDSLSNWTPGSFLTFNPSTKTYEPLVFPVFTFVPLPEVTVPQNILRLSSIPFVPEQHWNPRPGTQNSLLFLVFQTIAFLALSGKIVFVQINERKNRRHNDPFTLRKLKIKEASKALKNQQWEEFLSIAARLARDLIAEGNLRASKESLVFLIEADNQLRFSPSKTLLAPKETLKAHWENIRKHSGPFKTNHK